MNGENVNTEVTKLHLGNWIENLIDCLKDNFRTITNAASEWIETSVLGLKEVFLSQPWSFVAFLLGFVVWQATKRWYAGLCFFAFALLIGYDQVLYAIPLAIGLCLWVAIRTRLGEGVRPHIFGLLATVALFVLTGILARTTGAEIDILPQAWEETDAGALIMKLMVVLTIAALIGITVGRWVIGISVGAALGVLWFVNATWTGAFSSAWNWVLSQVFALIGTAVDTLILVFNALFAVIFWLYDCVFWLVAQTGLCTREAAVSWEPWPATNLSGVSVLDSVGWHAVPVVLIVAAVILLLKMRRRKAALGLGVAYFLGSLLLLPMPEERAYAPVDEYMLFNMPMLMAMLFCVVVWWMSSRRRLGLFSFFGLVFILNMRLWEPAMDTLSLVVVATLLAIALGIPLGIIAAISKPVKTVIMPILDFMQTLPAFVYLIPAISFFGTGRTPAIFATVIFAMPPAVRLTILGIEQTPEDLVEAADAFGSSKWQKLVKLQLPLAATSIRAGVNQTVLLSLSMVVIAAMIGAKGLGGVVWTGINRYEIGMAFEPGIGIVVMAIILDRMLQNVSTKSEEAAP